MSDTGHVVIRGLQAAGRVIGMDARTLLKRIQTGEGPPFRMAGKEYRFSRRALVEWFEAGDQQRGRSA